MWSLRPRATELNRRPAQILDLAAAASLADRGSAQLVLTNGVFDLLHRGHARFLEDCAKLGDLLVVGVNDDRSVARIKGPERPIQGLADRLAVLAAIRWVDHLVPFFDNDASELIHLIRPDIYVKGAEYDPTVPGARQLPERAAVKSVGADCQFLAMTPGLSTSALIASILAIAKTPDR